MYQKLDARPRHGYVGREAERLREPKPAGEFGRDTRPPKPDKRTGCDPGRPSLRNVLAVILGYVLLECVRCPADVQYPL